MSVTDQLTDACKRLDAAIKSRTDTARRVSTIVPKGKTLYAHVNYALDDLRRLDNARY